jgi:hypothetical protein
MAEAEVELKSPLVPLFQRGRITKMGSRRNLSPSVERKSAFFDSPLWKRGARGDFVLKPRD